MIKKELRKISLQYRTLASQMLKVDEQEEINYIKMFFDFISSTPFISDYIAQCHTTDYNFVEIFQNKSWRDILVYPDTQEAIVDYGYQLLQFVLDGPKHLSALGRGYTSSNKFKDMISAFMRKSVEPFVVALKSYLELSLIDCSDDDGDVATIGQEKQVFLSYCQRDADIADLIDTGLQDIIKDKAKISRDIRDVEYHESFKKFMQSIELHDFVIMLISDNYLKSRNCMFEVMEVVKDSQFRKKLVFIVLSDSDSKYYKTAPEHPIGANVYSVDGQTGYSLYWKNREDELQRQIEALGEPTYAIQQIKEKQVIQRIMFDLPDLLEFVKDSKGLSLTEHIEDGFQSIVDFIGI